MSRSVGQNGHLGFLTVFDPAIGQERFQFAAARSAARRRMMYDPTVGKWITEDPIGFEAGSDNLYAYVGNGPTNTVDPLGLWDPYLEHPNLLKESLSLADIAWPTDACRRFVQRMLIGANKSQDMGAVGGGPQTPGQQFQRHYCRKPGETKAQADAAYKAYINSELATFRRDVAVGNLTGCRSAIEAVGRLTHTWQDFYAHAVGVPPRPSNPVWAAKPRPSVGNPDNPGAGIQAPTYGGSNAEHGMTEPAEADVPGGKKMRWDAAVDFVALKLKKYIRDWLRKCSSCCK